MEHPSSQCVSRIEIAWASLRDRLHGLRGECGNALIEVAVVVGIFGVPLIIGTGEMGSVVYTSIEVSNAAHAAAAYGAQSVSAASNTSGITTAAQQEATDLGSRLSVSTSTYYACATLLAGIQFTGATAQTLANIACTGPGNHALEFVQVSTSAVVTPAPHFPGIPASFTLNGYSVMEVLQ